MKATAKCPGCGHEIATSESVESFSGKNWSSDFLVIKEMTLDWTIDVEGVEIQFAPQENEYFVNKKTGVAGMKQKAHLQRWKVAEAKADDDDDDDDDADLEEMEAELATIKAKQRKSASDKRLAAFLERDIKKAKAKAKAKRK